MDIKYMNPILISAKTVNFSISVQRAKNTRSVFYGIYGKGIWKRQSI
jgi:hypothetical protein